ncbi:MAG: heparan-alpha-glucosaminide N-acetyltransferase domain-containing protein [Leptospirales bacterium]
MNKKLKTRRIYTLDTIRGFVLLLMAFVNLYYATSSRQRWFFSHDGEIMAPGDLIAIFFFIMIGFNLALIEKYKNITGKKLLKYANKRAIVIIGIGMLLVSYTISLFANEYTVFFRSVLVILGISLILSSTLIYLFGKQLKYWPYIFIVLSITYGLVNKNPTGDYRFLSVAFLLTSIWGYMAGHYYTIDQKKFFKFMMTLGGISFVLAILHFLFFNEMPTRRTIHPSYIYISWGFWFTILGVILHYFRDRKEVTQNSFLNSIYKKINRSGAYPLSFWILHSFVVALFVLGATFYRYWSDHMLKYYFQMPAMPRSIENETIAILCSVAGTLLCFVLHLVFIRIYRKRTG